MPTKNTEPDRYLRIAASREVKAILRRVQVAILEKVGEDRSQKDLVDEAIHLLAKKYRVATS